MTLNNLQSYLFTFMFIRSIHSTSLGYQCLNQRKQCIANKYVIFSTNLFNRFNYFICENYILKKTKMASSILTNDIKFSNMSSGKNKEKVNNLHSWKVCSNDPITKMPLDPIKENYIRRNIKNAIFSAVDPTPLSGETRLAVFSEEVLDMLDLNVEVTLAEDFKGMVSGNWIVPSFQPLAHRYGGHQFGMWADQLGDGRAHLISVYINR